MLWITSKRHTLSSLTIPGLGFGHVSSIGGIFGKSRDLKTKTPKTQAACIFLRWNKSQKVVCTQMQKLRYGYVEMYFI